MSRVHSLLCRLVRLILGYSRVLKRGKIVLRNGMDGSGV